MSRKDPYTILCRWRNGWTLVEHRDTKQKYLRRAFRGTHKVNAEKVGFAIWRVTDPADNDAVVYVERLR